MPSHLMSAVLLWYRDEGFTPVEIALREGMSVRSVQAGLRAAGAIEHDLRAPEEWKPPVTPMYGCPPFVRVELGDRGEELTPECPHHGPIPRGSWLYCERCGASGLDGDPRLDRDPRTDPRPDPRPPAKHLSRRERRALKRSTARWNAPPPTGSPRPS
ncbi:MAG: hypothetical protein BGO49_04450 [Planctomycetales bacterium 71-10]|nr:MAG: hypothetical protein BGO49_04450 [Planctomycetales bacterium 71-10]